MMPKVGAPTVDLSSAPGLRADVVLRQYGHEAVAWSPDGRAALHLDAVAWLVVQMLDGATALRTLVRDVHDELGVPETVAFARIGRVVDQLDASNLLTTSDGAVIPEDDLGLFLGPPNP